MANVGSSMDVLLAIVVIVIVSCTVLSKPLHRHGYQLPFGWQNPKIQIYNGPELGPGQAYVCDRSMHSERFPFAEQRPFEDTCADSNNRIAFWLNNSIYGAALVTVGLAAAIGIGKGIPLARRKSS